MRVSHLHGSGSWQICAVLQIHIIVLCCTFMLICRAADSSSCVVLQIHLICVVLQIHLTCVLLQNYLTCVGLQIYLTCDVLHIYLLCCVADAEAIEQLRIAAAVFGKIGRVMEKSEDTKVEPFKIACYFACVQTPNLPNMSALQDCVERFYSAAGCELEIMVMSGNAHTLKFGSDEEAVLYTVRRAGGS